MAGATGEGAERTCGRAEAGLPRRVAPARTDVSYAAETRC